MVTTPASRKRNDPQRVLKSLEEDRNKEGAFITVSQHMNGEEIKKILTGISAFLNAFSDTDEYYIDIGMIRMKNINRETGDNDA